jgi:nitrite reductase/ring-hydroxylating ferredoxin subunit
MALTIYLSLIFLAVYLIGLAVRRWLFIRDRNRMAVESRAGRRVVARVDEMQPGAVKKFWLICQKYRLDAILINHRGNYYAYVNRCRHMPTPLDFIRDEFFSDDGRYLQCYTHGALYDFASGVCVSGPCKGESLYRLPVQVDRDEVLVGCPEGDLRPMGE